MICLKRKYAKKNKSKNNQNAFYMTANVSSRRYESYSIYLKDDSPHQTVIIMCESKRFSHISNCHNMLTLMQSCNVFHKRHSIFFATLDTCAATM